MGELHKLLGKKWLEAFYSIEEIEEVSLIN